MKTRSILALLLIALAAITTTTPALAAKKPEKTGTSTTAKADPGLLAALAKLEKAGILTTAQTDYFAQNAVKGKSCDGAQVGDLIIAAAKHLGCPGQTLNASLAHLNKKKIINSTETWQKNAKRGQKCTGTFTANIIERLAKSL